jgi:hypothetical protein
MPGADDVRIAHFLPGRVRIKAPALKGNPAQAETLSAAFAAVPKPTPTPTTDQPQ